MFDSVKENIGGWPDDLFCFAFPSFSEARRMQSFESMAIFQSTAHHSEVEAHWRTGATPLMSFKDA